MEGLGHEVKPTYTFTVTVRDATNLSDTQSVTVTVTDVETGTQAAPDVDIDDLDACKLKFSSGSDISLTEGGSARSVTVEFLDGITTDRQVTVPIDVRGSGAYSFTGLNSQDELVFSANARSDSFNMAAGQDADCDNESLTLELGSPAPSDVRLSTPNEVDVRITDDDDCVTVPIITIARHSNTAETIDEGESADFTLTASPAPTSKITVRVTVAEQGSYLTRPLPSDCLDAQPLINCNVSINANSSAGSLALPTLDDSIDEAHGVIQVTVESGTGYTVGSPSAASVVVKDNDVPAPTGIGGNGNILNGNVKVWWNSVDEADKYNLRYTLMDCGTVIRPHICESAGLKEIYDIPSTDTYTSTLISAGDGKDDKLQVTKLYTIRVQAVDALGRTSPWSDDVYGLYVTDDPPRLERFLVPDNPIVGDTYYPMVATIPLYSYWRKHEGYTDHWFPYRYCIDGKPADVSLSEGAVKDIFTLWNDALLQDYGVPLMSFEDLGGVSEQTCVLPKSVGRTLKFPDRAFQAIIFADDEAMDDAGCSRTDAPYKACWRTNSHFMIEFSIQFNGSPDFIRMVPGTILLRKAPTLNGNHRDWNRDATGIGSCSLVQHTLAHEIGHALGMGPLSSDGYYDESHGHDPNFSLISEYRDTSSPEHCGPLIWDIAAVMANYQSRGAE